MNSSSDFHPRDGDEVGIRITDQDGLNAEGVRFSAPYQSVTIVVGTHDITIYPTAKQVEKLIGDMGKIVEGSLDSVVLPGDVMWSEEEQAAARDSVEVPE